MSNTVGRAGAVPYISGIQYPGAVSSYRATATQFQGAVPVVSWLGDEEVEDVEVSVETFEDEPKPARGRPKKVTDDV